MYSIQHETMCIYYTQYQKSSYSHSDRPLHPLNIIISSPLPCLAHRSIKGHVVRTYVGNGERMVSGVVGMVIVENINFQIKQSTTITTQFYLPLKNALICGYGRLI